MVSGKRSERNIRRIALLIEYDGSKFCGMQYQQNSSSVQGELERALKILYGYEIRISSSGRTDTGVHALGQVVHYDDLSEFSLRRILTALNGITSRAISVKNAYLVSGDFHSRFHAFSREYLYKIYNNPVPSPFMCNRAMWMPQSCELDFIREICHNLIGEHDFKSFCKTLSADKPTVRTISEITVTKHDDLIHLNIKGKSFLHNMIRIIVGTIDYFNKNSIKPSKIIDILDAKDRKAAGPTAPASGLYLVKTVYNPSLDSYPSVF
ncbi:MAG: tRNA pseudouridine(38-40) synthase TruA [Spirochaetes bacterium]|nr:tRNA pseudouridine(38-40) synthase TruA [Spirochaetota bacterium]MBN2769153.1 tRNA pseudouridine(38-40) synthase TruA [Spirochaetota bacterium]